MSTPVFTAEVSRAPGPRGVSRATWELGVRDPRGRYIAPVTLAGSLATALRKAGELIEKRTGWPVGSVILDVRPLDLGEELLERARAIGSAGPLRKRAPSARALNDAAMAERREVCAALMGLDWSMADIGALVGLSANRIRQILDSAPGGPCR